MTHIELNNKQKKGESNGYRRNNWRCISIPIS